MRKFVINSSTDVDRTGKFKKGDHVFVTNSLSSRDKEAIILEQIAGNFDNTTNHYTPYYRIQFVESGRIRSIEEDVLELMPSERHNYRVCFNSGNKKIYEADNIVDALNYAVYEAGYDASDIWKIEEAEGDFHSWR